MVDEKDRNDEPETIEEPDIEDIEATDEEGGESSCRNKLKELREKLRACEEEKRNAFEDRERARADFLNSRRRLEEQLVRDRERATDGMILELLSLLDSFDGAMSDREAWEKVDERWRKGMESIHAKLLSILRANDVSPIEAEGVAFDPGEHEAVANVPVEDERAVDTVVSVLQKGYRRGKEILRPARVSVGVAKG